MALRGYPRLRLLYGSVLAAGVAFFVMSLTLTILLEAPAVLMFSILLGVGAGRLDRELGVQEDASERPVRSTLWRNRHGGRRMWSDPLLLAIFERFPPRATIFKESATRPEEEFELETTRPFYRWFGLGAQGCSAAGTFWISEVGSGAARSGLSATAPVPWPVWRSRKTRCCPMRRNSRATSALDT